MQPSDVLPQFASTFAAKRVYSEPYTVDGTTLITAAAISGGAGMRRDASERETGGGMGGSARPVGAYIVRDGQVTWKPALDLERIALRGLLVGALLTLGLVLSRRRT
jgi:hypothetical protein